jgi:hypothetical protein
VLFMPIIPALQRLSEAGGLRVLGQSELHSEPEYNKKQIIHNQSGARCALACACPLVLSSLVREWSAKSPYPMSETAWVLTASLSFCPHSPTGRPCCPGKAHRWVTISPKSHSWEAMEPGAGAGAGNATATLSHSEHQAARVCGGRGPAG